MRALLILGWACVVAFTQCPVISSTSFELADVFLQWSSANSVSVLQRGVQFIDINGDSLPDQLLGTADLIDRPNYVWQCVYLNTGCAWVPQANYTGPDNSCAHPTAVNIRGIQWPLKKLTVKQFTTDISDFYGLRRADVTVRVAIAEGRWQQQSPTYRMEELSQSPLGFLVVLGPTEAYPYMRHRQSVQPVTVPT